MVLTLTGAPSSRAPKRAANKLALRRSSSSPFGSYKQRKPVQRSQSKPEKIDDNEDEDFNARLCDQGLVTTLAADLPALDVSKLLEHSLDNRFSPLPESGGFGSKKTAETLCLQRDLPRVLSMRHLHALTHSATATEKQIVRLINEGVIRKVVVPTRAAEGEYLILWQDLENMVMKTIGLKQELAEKYLLYLKTHSNTLIVSRFDFSLSDIMSLMRAGFLTSSHAEASASLSSVSLLSSSTATSLSSIARAASGSIAAVGGESAVHEAGGGGQGRHVKHEDNLSGEAQFNIALPNMGSLIRLLGSARSHLMSLLIKSKYKELPEFLLRERYEGGISGDDPASKAKKYRGEFKGVLPAQTRKWKQLYGLTFDFVIAECLGAGLIELFETPVGRAVRTV